GWYQGVATRANAHLAPSLGGQTIFAPGGSNDVAQQTALDSMKKMMAAINLLNQLSKEDVDKMEANWETDILQAMIAKANRAALEDSGSGIRPSIEYNEKFQYMLRHHLIRGFENGEPAVWSVE